MSEALEFRRVDNPLWQDMSQSEDATLFQSKAWVEFVAESQGANPVVVDITKHGNLIGWFIGLIKRKFGLKILGSPFPGWTTSYMGFNLTGDVDRKEVLKSFISFTKSELKVAHLEIMDRRLTVEDVRLLGYQHRIFSGYEVALFEDESRIWSNLASSARRNIQKGEREGIVVKEAGGEEFALEYYQQLTEIFTRQKLKPTYSIDRVKLLLKKLAPTGRLLCLNAHLPDGKIIATGIFPADRYRMYFWGGASRLDYRHLRPNELIQWFAMRHWSSRGVRKYDMGGGGEYKRKYGGTRIEVPWMRHSHLPGLEFSRNLAKRFVAFRQKQMR